jgi:hypothetical protein
VSTWKNPKDLANIGVTHPGIHPDAGIDGRHFSGQTDLVDAPLALD